MVISIEENDPVISLRVTKSKEISGIFPQPYTCVIDTLCALVPLVAPARDSLIKALVSASPPAASPQPLTAVIEGS